MPQVLTYTQLAHFDDLLVDCLIDKLYYWSKTRKVREVVKSLRGVPREVILKEILHKYIISSERVSMATHNTNLQNAVDKFVQLPAIRNFLGRYPDTALKQEFSRHVKRYLQLYSVDCGFEVDVTDRYKSRSNNEESCIVSRKSFVENEEIKYLTGILVELTEEEEIELMKSGERDFSIINTGRTKGNCLMLGPARFVNHDCQANAKFASRGGHKISLLAAKEILPGEQITVEYAKNYFGKNNRECLCATCERLQRNGYDKNLKIHKNNEKNNKKSLELPLQLAELETAVTTVATVSDDQTQTPQTLQSTPTLPGLQTLQALQVAQSQSAQSSQSSTLTPDTPPAYDHQSMHKYSLGSPDTSGSGSLSGSTLDFLRLGSEAITDATESDSENLEKTPLFSDSESVVSATSQESASTSSTMTRTTPINSTNSGITSSGSISGSGKRTLRTRTHSDMSVVNQFRRMHYQKPEKATNGSNRQPAKLPSKQININMLKAYYTHPFSTEFPDNIEVTECVNCHVPVVHDYYEEEKLSVRLLKRTLCPRCHRHAIIYNAFWPVTCPAEPEPIELYKNRYPEPPQPSSDSDSSDEEEDVAEKRRRAVRRKTTRYFAPAVEEEVKPRQPRRVSAWLMRKLEKDGIDANEALGLKKPKTLISAASARAQRRKSAPAKLPTVLPTRRSARFGDGEYRLPPRTRKPSLRALEFHDAH